MTLDPDLLVNYAKAVVTHGLNPDDSTIDCGGMPCSGCPLVTGNTCKLNEVADTHGVDYVELERTIIHTIVKQTYPELFL